MDCPQCGAPMVEEALRSRHGQAVAIDLCFTCQGLWFDDHESLRLSPAATLKLFRLIGDHANRSQPSSNGAGKCPRCRAPLRATSDMQRNTRFEYLRCPAGHGRWTTFYSFLREKDYISPPSPAQMAELRQTVETVNCANCGAPIDLTTSTSCERCGSPVSMLDLTRSPEVIARLQRADRTTPAVDPDLALRLEQARRSVNDAFDAFERDRRRGTTGLLGASLTSLARLFKLH
jgi:Zn-finger nucleic acid-binding protein